MHRHLGQFDKAAELAEWKTRWKPRGQSAGPVKRGLGLGFSAWGGGGHTSQCKVTLHADGGVQVDIGTQDLGTGTRTVIAQVWRGSPHQANVGRLISAGRGRDGPVIIDEYVALD